MQRQPRPHFVTRAAGTVRDVAVAHVQQEVDVVKAVVNSEMLQEIAGAEEVMSREYAAKTGERVRMVQELQAKLAALDHHLSVRVSSVPPLAFRSISCRCGRTTAAGATLCTS